MPTETVYGLAANALDAKACREIFRAKRRPANDPLIVHVADLRMLATIAEPNAAVPKLARAFWPGPLTLVLKRKAVIPDVVTAGLPSVAVRMPAHPLLRRLLRLCGLPLAAPSANPFGYISPTTARHVQDGLGSSIAHILDGGPCRHGLESTIVDIRDPQRPVLLRPGVITAAEIGRVLGVPVRTVSRQRSTQDPAPGAGPPGPPLQPAAAPAHPPAHQRRDGGPFRPRRSVDLLPPAGLGRPRQERLLAQRAGRRSARRAAGSLPCSAAWTRAHGPGSMPNSRRQTARAWRSTTGCCGPRPRANDDPSKELIEFCRIE